MSKIKIKQREKLNNAIFGDDEIPSVLKKILGRRIIAETSFEMSKKLSNLILADGLLNINTGISILYDAVMQDQKILIVGDFDVDGATSTSVAIKSLRAMGVDNVSFIIPNRFKHGYGLSPKIIERAHELEADLIITVDNGITSYEGVAKAKSYGMKVIITDHHLAENNKLPIADCIINPNLKECQFASKNLAGVGVAFYFFSAFNTYLKKNNWYEKRNIPIADMKNFLDLVAIGTIADMVKLDYNNRLLVSFGLALIRKKQCQTGLRALIDLSGLDYANFNYKNISFQIAPKINAAGRLDNMQFAVNCLICEDYYQAHKMAIELNQMNNERKKIESRMFLTAKAEVSKISENGTQPLFSLCLFDRFWHQGVVGIIAGKIKEEYNIPSIVFAESNENNRLKGSGRSIKNFNITEAVGKINQENQGIIHNFGGHAMATGLEIEKNEFDQFKLKFDSYVKENCPQQNVNYLYIDDELTTAELSLDSAVLLRDFSAWGEDFPEPVFGGEFNLVDYKWLNDIHLLMRIQPNNTNNNPIKAIFFNPPKSVYYDFNHSLKEKLYLVYTLETEVFRHNLNFYLSCKYLETI